MELMVGFNTASVLIQRKLDCNSITNCSVSIQLLFLFNKMSPKALLRYESFNTASVLIQQIEEKEKCWEESFNTASVLIQLP